MARYELLVQSLKAHFSAYEAFETRGKTAIAALLRSFAEYIQAPAHTCRVGPPGTPLDANPTTPIDHVAELQQDGWFAACLIIQEESPLGVSMRLTFLARIDGDSTVVKLEHDPQDFRLQELTPDALAPFFSHVFTTAMDHLTTEPFKLAAGSAKRPIGFT
jgi:hypothetical protein